MHCLVAILLISIGTGAYSLNPPIETTSSLGLLKIKGSTFKVPQSPRRDEIHLKWNLTLDPNTYVFPDFILDLHGNLLLSTARLSSFMLVSLQPTTGNVLWNRTFPTSANCFSANTLATSIDAVYVVLQCSQVPYIVMCVNSTSGKLLWSQNGYPTSYLQYTTVDSENNLYVLYTRTFNSSQNSQMGMGKVDLQGHVIWDSVLPFYPTSSSMMISPPKDGKEFIIVTRDNDPNYYFFDTVKCTYLGNVTFFWDPTDGWWPQYNLPVFKNDGTMLISAYTLVSLNADKSLRYYTANYSISNSYLNVDEKNGVVYSGYLHEHNDYDHATTYFYTRTQCYDSSNGRLQWNSTVLLATNAIITNFGIYPPAIRPQDSLAIYTYDHAFVGKDVNGNVVFTYDTPFYQPGQVSWPTISDDGRLFFVIVVFIDHYELWAVPLPPATSPGVSNNPKEPNNWHQCGSPCTSHEVCDGYSCSKCLNGACVPGGGKYSLCTYRGDCDERITTCISGSCRSLDPGCGEPCDYYATCGSEPGCYYCDASMPGYCTSGK